jgi:hypothetical protein
MIAVNGEACSDVHLRLSVSGCRYCGNVVSCVLILGSLLTVRGLLTFSSARSMEIEVVVELENIFHHNANTPMTTSTRGRAVDAFFTFVSIDNQGKALPVPPLQVIEFFRYE